MDGSQSGRKVPSAFVWRAVPLHCFAVILLGSRSLDDSLDLRVAAEVAIAVTEAGSAAGDGSYQAPAALTARDGRSELAHRWFGGARSDFDDAFG